MLVTNFDPQWRSTLHHVYIARPLSWQYFRDTDLIKSILQKQKSGYNYLCCWCIDVSHGTCIDQDLICRVNSHIEVVHVHVAIKRLLLNYN